MVFSSTIFLFMFLPVTLLGYYILRGKGRNIWLLFVSVIFFGWSQLGYLWLIIVSILINYIGALLIGKMISHKKFILSVVIISNILPLIYFKYFDYIMESIYAFTQNNLDIEATILPIGISFFTFQGMSYVIDVYRGEVPLQKNLLNVALYIVLFPQLVAGPIVRYTDITLEIDCRKENLENFCQGIERFIVGLAKKVIIANTMAAMVDSIWESGPDLNSCIIAWFGSIGYALQIYFDFSGYSDMAIGLGRMFGFHFPENFKLPYISKSISEFWRRWHISLSSWFRDYVYIPLGGNRKNVYGNLLIVFALTGIWHGAGAQFLLWGLWNGLFIVLERALNKNKTDTKSDSSLCSWKSVIKKVYVLLVVNIGWVIFRAPNVVEGIRYLGLMFGIAVPKQPGFTLLWYLDKWTVFIMIIGIFFASSIPMTVKDMIKKIFSDKAVTILKYCCLIGLLYICILRIVSGTYNPFIYFQF